MHISHHGIKGQQWGVRHGPPYPIDKDNAGVTIKKGTHFRRLSMYDERHSTGHAYVNYLKDDIEHYRGFFTARLKALNKGAEVYSIDMEARSDLKAPSKNERVKTFIELYSKDKTLRKELGSYHKSDTGRVTPLPKFFYEWQYSNLKFDDVKTKGYDTFVRAVGGNEYVRSAYFKELSKKGYSFVTDDMDAGRFGKAPSIVFDRSKDTVYIDQTPVSLKEASEIVRRRGIYNKNARG